MAGQYQIRECAYPVFVYVFFVQGGKWTGYGLSRSMFVTFASSKRGLISLICCSVINIFC